MSLVVRLVRLEIMVVFELCLLLLLFVIIIAVSARFCDVVWLKCRNDPRIVLHVFICRKMAVCFIFLKNRIDFRKIRVNRILMPDQSNSLVCTPLMIPRQTGIV